MILLASGSPRRIEILSQITTEFKTYSPNADEDYQGATPEDTVLTIASRKWDAVEDKNNYSIVITADTLVYFNGEYLGKPKNRQDAIEMLCRLNGKTHNVVTGIVISGNNKVVKKAITSSVTFNLLTKSEIETYVDTHEVLDKAGSYAIQDGVMVKSYTGEYTNIVGMPKLALQEMLVEVGQ